MKFEGAESKRKRKEYYVWPKIELWMGNAYL